MPELQPDSALDAFGKRFFAAVIDMVILSAACYFVSPLIPASFFSGIFLLASWLYCAYFESSPRRATPGKMALNLKVSDENGEKISFGKASLRFAGKFLSAATMGVGFLMIAFSDRRQALHDKIAGTIVRDKNSQEKFSEEKFSEENPERVILQIARRHAGKISPAIIAAESDISLDSAGKFLEKMCIRGICLPEATEDGRVEYHFPDFLPPGK